MKHPKNHEKRDAPQKSRKVVDFEWITVPGGG